MALNAGIILSGQQFDLGRAMSEGLNLAAQQKQFDQQNALANLYKTQGANILAGDQGSLNALAQYDPAAALDIQSTHQQMDYRAEDQQMQRDNARKAAEEALKAQAASLDAAKVAREAAELEATLSGAAFFYQNKDQAGYDGFLRSKGVDPAQYPFQSFPAHAAEFGGVLDAMKAFAPPAAPEWRAATPEEAARYGSTAGQINDQTGEFKRTPVDSGTVIETGPDGRTIVRQGPGVAADGGTGVNSGDALRTQITDAESMLGMIGEIANDPALSKVTGSIEGGGGNNVDDLNMLQRGYYGGDGLAVIQKIAQLQGNAWLGARALLKGGGQITDYESKKAESAMARLSRAQGDAEFKAALKDLEDALREGVKKLQAAQGGASSAAPAPTSGTASEMSDEDLLKLYGGE